MSPVCFFVNRHFEVGDKGAKDAAKLFSVPDFVGDACKAIASRIRGAVAGVQFDDFHKVQSYFTKFGLNLILPSVCQQPNITKEVTVYIKDLSRVERL